MIVVSSGSIALGRRVLGLPRGALSLEQSQAAAAVGQIRLARAYESVLTPHRITTAQVLVTLEDSENRRRYLNSRRTLGTLLELGVVPIVNENDTVATDEIRYGDNDRLAAQVASMAGADVLILLSDVDGLYTGDPRLDPTARRLEIVPEITPEIEAMAGDAGSGLSKGGMVTKLMAAKTATGAGCAMAITARRVRAGRCARWPGRALHLVRAATAIPAAARKRWIAGMKPRGRAGGRRRRAAALGAASRCCPPVCAASKATSSAATRSTIRGPGRRRWSRGRWRATMRTRRGPSWATARTEIEAAARLSGPRGDGASRRHGALRADDGGGMDRQT